MSEIWCRMYICLHVKYHLFLSDVNETSVLSTDFRKIFKHQISWKSFQWELSCPMRMDGRTDRQTESLDAGNSRFPQFLQTRLKMPAFRIPYSLIVSDLRAETCRRVNFCIKPVCCFWGTRISSFFFRFLIVLISALELEDPSLSETLISMRQRTRRRIP